MGCEVSRVERGAVVWMLLALLACGVGAQNLVVQVNLEEEGGNEREEVEIEDGEDDDRGIPMSNEACSILQVGPNGTLTELVSSADILALSGETTANCGDTGLAVAPNGTIYFSEDVSDHIFRRLPDGTLSIFVTEAELDKLVGEADSDNGMDVGPDGRLFVADEGCDCIYTVSTDGETLEIIVTETEIGTVTGNIDDDEDRGEPGACTSGPPVADLEGGLVVSPTGVVYFADDGEGCNPDRVPPRGLNYTNSLDSVLSATPDGKGGYDLAVVADEDDLFASLPYPDGYGACTNSFANLDLDLELGSDGVLYVLDDRRTAPPPQACEEDDRGTLGALVSESKVIRIDSQSGAVSLVAAGADFGALSGAVSEQANLEGGIGISGSTLYVGDRISDVEVGFRGEPESTSTIFEVSTAGAVSVFVSNEDLQNFYGPRYPGRTARLSAGLDVAPSTSVLEIPVFDRTGAGVFVALLSLLAVWTVRRRL